MPVIKTSPHMNRTVPLRDPTDRAERLDAAIAQLICGPLVAHKVRGALCRAPGADRRPADPENG